MPRIKICKEDNCHNAATSSGYCRLHYLKNWREIQADKKKKAAKNLNRYVESILKRHPDKYVEEIKKDIRSKGFDERVGDQFGAGGAEEPWTLFEPGTSDEEIDELIDQIKIEKEF